MNIFKKIKVSFLTFFFSIIVFACSSTPDIPDEAVHFHTRITSSGLKHFQLSVIVAPPARRISPEAQNSQRNPEERMARKTEKNLKLLAEQKVLESGFCREGYWYLGNNYYGRNVYLRGECNEAATNEDRQKFPDTLKYW